MRSRKITFLEASETCLVADATSEVCELQCDDQAYQELKAISYPWTEMRKELRRWENR